MTVIIGNHERGDLVASTEKVEKRERPDSPWVSGPVSAFLGTPGQEKEPAARHQAEGWEALEMSKASPSSTEATIADPPRRRSPLLKGAVTAALALAILAFSSTSRPAMLSGTYWWPKCTSAPRAREWWQCLDYIYAVMELHRAMASGQGVKVLFLYCVTAAQTPVQLVGAVVEYLRDNPERRHRPMVELVTYAMMKRFPCEKSERGAGGGAAVDGLGL
jgi:hypothetical protein